MSDAQRVTLSAAKGLSWGTEMLRYTQYDSVWPATFTPCHPERSEGPLAGGRTMLRGVRLRNGIP